MNKKKKIKQNKNNEKVKEQAINFLKQQPGKAFNYKQIAAGIGVKGKVPAKTLWTMLEQMAEEGLIEAKKKGKYTISFKPVPAQGSISITRDGYGFVKISDEEEVFIPASKVGTALHGDLVKINITREKGRGQKKEGEVKSIISRASERFVGIVQLTERHAFVIIDDPKIHVDFFIPRAYLNGAKDGDKVVLAFVRWTEKNPEGKILSVLGKAGEHETEMHAILMEFGFETQFPKAVEQAARKFTESIPAKEIRKRKDMRDILTFTIDPADAKDFDDALSYRSLNNGRVEVGIHIADVSYYVQPDTVLDQEAYQRATSVYLVDRTVPMLPEYLSNGLCSLKPNVDRLAFSALFELDDKGKVHKEWYGKTVIHSDRRYTYEEAQALIESGESEAGPVLQHLNKIAYALREERFKKGSIQFEEDEIKFELDENDKPVRVYRKVRKDAHKLIEDYMLLANRKVAHHVHQLRKRNPLPFVYRIHDRPDMEKLQNLKTFAQKLGYSLELEDDKRIAGSLNKLMLAVEHKPEQHLIHTVAVRTMSKAVYTTENIGHYGLGFEYYTHFTSPIRRYPDLMVHRLLAQYLSGNFEANQSVLEEQCKHCSKAERNAMDAERMSIKYKQVEYLEDKIGQEFEGIISGVTQWGIYVEIKESRSEGMISLRDIDGDYYEFDEKNYCVRGYNTGKEIRLGDKVLVEVKTTNLHRRLIDFVLLEVLSPVLSSRE